MVELLWMHYYYYYYCYWPLELVCEVCLACTWMIFAQWMGAPSVNEWEVTCCWCHVSGWCHRCLLCCHGNCSVSMLSQMWLWGGINLPDGAETVMTRHSAAARGNLCCWRLCLHVKSFYWDWGEECHSRHWKVRRDKDGVLYLRGVCVYTKSKLGRQW